MNEQFERRDAAYGIGQPVTRFEDPRLLRGEGRYVNDVALAGMAHLAYVRSPHAHARIVSIDAADARAAPGVLGVYTVEDLEGDGIGTTAPALKRTRPDGAPMFWRAHPGLAKAKVRHVGDPVAIVVAETLAQAKDAAELVAVDYDALPAGAPVWDECPDNVSNVFEIGNRAATEAAFAGAARVVSRRYAVSRVHAQYIEPRGAVGAWEPGEGRYTLHCDLQYPHRAREVLADLLKVAEHQVRVVSGDVGGAFGRIPLADGAASDGGEWLTRGFGIDRQPIVSPDGRRVIFSSRRSGNLDIWELTLATGAVRPLTDDPGEDWDPALSPDGRQLIWSSNRSGTYEIWIADADGSNPRRITSDGDAENPTATPDGRWIVYASGAPANVGLWKIRADGTQATRLVAGYQLNPEVSPDGEHILYRFTLAGSTRVQVRVLRVADGADVPFEIVAAGRGTGREGRARWLRGGRAIAFTAADDSGVVGVYSQEFAPGVDTSATRRKLGGFDPDSFAESFGVARDDSFLIVAGLEQPSNLMSAENVPGLDGGRRAPR